MMLKWNIYFQQWNSLPGTRCTIEHESLTIKYNYETNKVKWMKIKRQCHTC